MFVPATPGAELRNSIQEIVTRKTAEVGMTATVKETGGTKMRDSLVRLDLTGCIYPQCRACKSDLGGASHTRSTPSPARPARPTTPQQSITESQASMGSTGSGSTRLPSTTRTPRTPWRSTSPSITRTRSGTRTSLTTKSSGHSENVWRERYQRVSP